MRKVAFSQLLLSTLFHISACSSIQFSYHAPHYAVQTSDAVKHITLSVWAPPSDIELAHVVAQVAYDRINLRKNYLIHEQQVGQRPWSDGCVEQRQGVLFIRVLESAIQNELVKLFLSIALFRCQDGALLHDVYGEIEAASQNEDLSNLIDSYLQEVNPTASQYAAPVFILLKELIEHLPNPVLNDEEQMQKIELEAS